VSTFVVFGVVAGVWVWLEGSSPDVFDPAEERVSAGVAVSGYPTLFPYSLFV
jgi:hypothetical protein